VRLAQVDSGTGPVVVEVGDGWMRPLAYHADLTTLIRDGVNPRCLPRGGRFPEPLRLISPLVPGKIVAIRFDPLLTERGDWEVGRAVVIGKRLQESGPAEALAGMFGYTVVNDVRPIGPVVVTPDDIADLQRVGEILSCTSTYCTLEPGDLVMTGAPDSRGDVVEVEIEGIGVLRNPVLARPGTP
jgi:hypothetical protein